MFFAGRMHSPSRDGLLLAMRHLDEEAKDKAKSQVLLHLTDLHFGCDASANEVASRALALRGLLAIVRELEPDWSPTLISISGDLGWKGQHSDYVSAGEWLTELLTALKLSSDRVCLCPGNHDIDQSISRKYARPKNGVEADRILAVPVTAIYKEAFGELTSFAKSFGIPPYRLSASGRNSEVGLTGGNPIRTLNR
jgi:hypothetical protein